MKIGLTPSEQSMLTHVGEQIAVPFAAIDEGSAVCSNRPWRQSVCIDLSEAETLFLRELCGYWFQIEGIGDNDDVTEEGIVLEGLIDKLGDLLDPE